MQRKNNKGITLVALIITIVVLLILAAVAIGEAKNSEIIGYAKNAKSDYEREKDIENTRITEMETLLEKYATKSEVTYADFWKAAYNKVGNEFAVISNHIAIGFGETEEKEVVGELYYGDASEDDLEEMHYFMSMISISDAGEVQPNQWYSASNSDVDISSFVPLPEEISTNKSGTAYAGYEDLCALFDKAIGTEGCTPYVPN